MDLSTAMNGAGTIKLGDRTFLLSHFTLGDIGEIEGWVKERVISSWSIVNEAIEKLQPLKKLDPATFEKCRQDIILAAMKEENAAGGSVMNTAKGQSTLMGMDGLAFILFLSIRRKEPTVTYDQVLAWSHMADMKYISGRLKFLFEQLRGEVDGEENDENPPMPQSVLPIGGKSYATSP